MRHGNWLCIALLATASLGCRESNVASDPSSSSSETATAFQEPSSLVPTGTSMDVTLNTVLSSETAHVGTAWTGIVENGVEGIPSGSQVSGTVTAVVPAERGNRAMLDLGLRSITVDGKRYSVHGGTEAVVAGSPRARNLGAIAGSAAAGAIIGKAVSGSQKGAVVGGILGGATAGKVVADSKGYQVVLKPGMTLTFTTSEAVRVRA